MFSKNIFETFLSAFLICYFFDTTLTLGSRKLLLSQILCRHGARAPLRPYPNDPYQNESIWPNGWGGLTELGKIGQYKAGEFLKTKYNGFLSPKFSSKEVYVVSSDYDRTIVSAQALLSGLFKFTDANEYKFGEEHKIRWELFPVHTIPAEIDSLIQPKTVLITPIKNVYTCPRYLQLLKESVKSPEVKAHTQDNLELLHSLVKYSGRNMTRLTDAPYVVGPLLIEDLHNLTIPDWGREILSNEETMRICSFGFKVLTLTDEMKRLAAGPLLAEFIKNMRNKIAGADERKMYIYSGHDLIVGNMLDLLGIHDQHWVGFSNLFMLELYEVTKETGEQSYLVEVWYRNTKVNPYQMTIPGCHSPCTLDIFVQTVRRFIPVDLKKECEVGPVVDDNKNTSSTSSNKSPNLNILQNFMFAFVLAVTATPIGSK